MNIATRPHVPLGQFMLNRGGSTDPAKQPDALFTLYSIPAFDVGAPELVQGCDIGSPKKNVESGDVLLSRIVPHIRRSWIVGEHPDSKILASGEWIVFRSDKMHAPYLRNFLLSDVFHQQFMQTVAGVGGSLLRANPKYVAEIAIPLPALNEQQRIAAILDKADALRRKRKSAIDLLENLKQSIFLEIFGDLERFPIVSVGQSLARQFRNGLSPAKAGTFTGKVLTLSAITSGVFKPSAIKEAMFATELPINQRVEQGEFLICRGNGNRSLVGVGVFAPHSMPDTLFPDTIIAGTIDRDRFHPQYFQDVWNGKLVRSQIEKSARTTNGTFKVNQGGLEAINIPMPDISLQETYGDKVTLIEQAKNLAFAQHSLLNTAFSSLQSRAFAGQL